MEVTATGSESSQQPGDLIFEDEWQIDEASATELGGFTRTPSSPPEPPRQYDSSARQILSEKSQLGSTFRLRIERVDFGRFKDESACRIMLEINFTPKNYTGARRFRDAKIRAHIQPGDGDPTVAAISSQARDPYLKVSGWSPRYIEGPHKTAFEKFGFNFQVAVAPVTAAPSAEYSFSAPRESRRRIHGTIEDPLERLLQWKIEENRVSKDGVPSVCRLGMIVQYRDCPTFNLSVTTRATSVAGIALKGGGMSPVYFYAGAGPKSTNLIPSASITGGSLAVGNALFVSSGRSAAKTGMMVFSEQELDSLTDMEALIKAKN